MVQNKKKDTELFASDQDVSIISRRRTGTSNEGSVGFIYKDGVEQGMYDFDLGADAFWFNDSSFDTMDDIAASLGGEFSWEESDLLDNVTESASSMFESAKKKAKIKAKDGINESDDSDFHVGAAQGRGREIGFSASDVTTLQKAMKIAGTKTEHSTHFTKGFFMGRKARVSNYNKESQYQNVLMKDGSIKSK